MNLLLISFLCEDWICRYSLNSECLGTNSTYRNLFSQQMRLLRLQIKNNYLMTQRIRYPSNKNSRIRLYDELQQTNSQKDVIINNLKYQLSKYQRFVKMENYELNYFYSMGKDMDKDLCFNIEDSIPWLRKRIIDLEKDRKFCKCRQLTLQNNRLQEELEQLKQKEERLRNQLNFARTNNQNLVKQQQDLQSSSTKQNQEISQLKLQVIKLTQGIASTNQDLRLGQQQRGVTQGITDNRDREYNLEKTESHQVSEVKDPEDPNNIKQLIQLVKFRILFYSYYDYQKTLADLKKKYQTMTSFNIRLALLQLSQPQTIWNLDINQAISLLQYFYGKKLSIKHKITFQNFLEKLLKELDIKQDQFKQNITQLDKKIFQFIKNSDNINALIQQSKLNERGYHIISRKNLLGYLESKREDQQFIEFILIRFSRCSYDLNELNLSKFQQIYKEYDKTQQKQLQNKQFHK